MPPTAHVFCDSCKLRHRRRTYSWEIQVRVATCSCVSVIFQLTEETDSNFVSTLRKRQLKPIAIRILLKEDFVRSLESSKNF